MTKENVNTVKMPRNWKSKVVEILAGKGITVTETRVYDLAKGRVKDPVMAKMVLREMKKVRNQHMRNLAALAQQKAEIFI
jgi:hypothetical protein